MMRIALISVFFLAACSPILAAEAEFPSEFRGFWVDDQATCDLLKKASPADLRDGQRWLKIAATDILGTTQGRLLREIPAPRAPVKKSFEFQIADDMGLIAQLTFLGRGLSETVTGGHAHRRYFKCF
ncbi:hypothetical protein ACVINW_004883 [Bradyrhizobium sp. USDA 4461]